MLTCASDVYLANSESEIESLTASYTVPRYLGIGLEIDRKTYHVVAFCKEE